MAKPVQEMLHFNKEKVMNKLEEVLPTLDMKLVGSKYDLGLMSIKAAGSGIILYAQVVEVDEQEAKISVAPGLSNLKDRDQSEVPESTIAKVIKNLRIELEN